MMTAPLNLSGEQSPRPNRGAIPYGGFLLEVGL